MTARIEVGVEGELVLVAPVAAAVGEAVARHNCSLTMKAMADRVSHLRERAKLLGVFIVGCLELRRRLQDCGWSALKELETMFSTGSRVKGSHEGQVRNQY